MGCASSRDRAATQAWLESRRREQERQGVRFVGPEPRSQSIPANIINPPTTTAAPRPQSIQRATIGEAGKELTRILDQTTARPPQSAPSQPRSTAASIVREVAAAPALPRPEADLETGRRKDAFSALSKKPAEQSTTGSVVDWLTASRREKQKRVAEEQRQGHLPASSSSSVQELTVLNPASHVPGCRCMVCQPSDYEGKHLLKRWKDSCAPGCLCPPCMASTPPSVKLALLKSQGFCTHKGHGQTCGNSSCVCVTGCLNYSCGICYPDLRRPSKSSKGPGNPRGPTNVGGEAGPSRKGAGDGGHNVDEEYRSR